MTDATKEAIAVVKPLSSEDVSWETWSEGKRFGSRFRHLTRAAVGDAYHVGLQIEELSPGKQSSPAHYHMVEEEQVLVLHGEMTLRLGSEMFRLKAGDYVCFPAGQKAGHCFINEGSSICRFLIVGERKPDDVCVYTDSNKLMVRSLGSGGNVFDRTATRSYWDGEATD